VTKLIELMVMNLVTPKGAALLEILFKKLNCAEFSLLNECSCLARVIGVAKFTNVRDIILVTLCRAT
jgi:hypothetical protein